MTHKIKLEVWPLGLSTKIVIHGTIDKPANISDDVLVKILYAMEYRMNLMIHVTPEVIPLRVHLTPEEIPIITVPKSS